MACRLPAPCHYLNQCWNIVSSNLRNKLQWNLKWNSCTFIQENAFENVVCEMAAILSRPQCVKNGPCYFSYGEALTDILIFTICVTTDINNGVVLALALRIKAGIYDIPGIGSRNVFVENNTISTVEFVLLQISNWEMSNVIIRFKSLKLFLS